MTIKRRRHIPLRTCISCRQVRPKRDMVRIVRTADGTLVIDPRGKQSGRGTYICLEAGCGPAALAAGTLSRALKCRVTAEAVAALRAAMESQLEESPRPDPRAAETRTD